MCVQLSPVHFSMTWSARRAGTWPRVLGRKGIDVLEIQEGVAGVPASATPAWGLYVRDNGMLLASPF